MSDKQTSVNTLPEDSYLVQEYESERVKREQLAGGLYRLSDTIMHPNVEAEGSALNNPRIKT